MGASVLPIWEPSQDYSRSSECGFPAGNRATFPFGNAPLLRLNRSSRGRRGKTGGKLPTALRSLARGVLPCLGGPVACGQPPPPCYARKSGIPVTDA